MARLLRLWGTKALAKLVTLVLRRSKLKTQSIFKTGIIGLLSLVVLACEEDGNRMTEPDLSSALMGGALDMEVGNLLPDYETIDTKLRTAQMSGRVGKKDVERVRGRVNEYKALEEKIKAAVDAGEMTRDEAQVALARAKKEMFGAGPKDGKGPKRPPPPIDLDKMEERIQTAIADGKLTGEKAEAMLAALAKGREAEAAVKAAVDAGEMTAEDGKKRLQAALRKIFPGPKDGKGPKRPPPPKKGG